MTKRHNQEKLSVLKRAIRHYGKRNQVQKAIEEMAELMQRADWQKQQRKGRRRNGGRNNHAVAIRNDFQKW